MGEICGVQGKQNRRNSETQRLNSGRGTKKEIPDSSLLMLYPAVLMSKRRWKSDYRLPSMQPSLFPVHQCKNA